MNEENIDTGSQEYYQNEGEIQDVLPVSGMYKSWFLDYASYVILERAVPAIEDGFKPVQRRIMHALKEMDDGRYNKVANVIGSAMQYHPHGDTSIGDAIVHIGQKNLLIDTQGNWGDVRTGDGAAAARYIEARLSKFALDVVYSPQITEWQLSYDGRKTEPVTFPVKFPLLLAQGVEGIAVGLSTKILPHNFCELIKASIDILKGKSPKIYPDFPTGGMADFSEYNQGMRGGKVKVRARIEEFDKKNIAIKNIPFGTTTTALIESIIKANDRGKIKIKQVVDNTAKDVEVLVTLALGQSPNITIDALYAFTDCEVSISPNTCVIVDEKPLFIEVRDILKTNTEQTVQLLKQELEIRRAELMEKILFLSLEKIFIENRIYRDIEECETWEAVIETIDKGLEPYKPQFYRNITEKDIVRLTEVKIKRISRFDTFEADESMNKLQEELKEKEYHLANIIDYSIVHYQKLLEKYGKGRERQTEIRSFDTIKATVVAANNQKLYVNYKDGFIGYGLKKDEFISECSDIDDVIAICRDGKCIVSRIAEKVFMGKDILYAGVWKKGDERMVFNMIYLDGQTGRSMMKRFSVNAVTRDKAYDLTKGTKGSKVLYLSANPNGEAEIVTVKLALGAKARHKVFDVDFANLEIKGRAAAGNIMTKYSVRKIVFKSAGVSTLDGLDIWYDKSVGRLNRDRCGELIGNFNSDDMILVIYHDGHYVLTSYALTNRYEPKKITYIKRFDPKKVISAVHYDGTNKNYYVKRFVIETNTKDKRYCFISEEKGSKLILVTTEDKPQVQVEFIKDKGKDKEVVIQNLDSLIDAKGWKAIGNKLSQYIVKKVKLIEPMTKEEIPALTTSEPIAEQKPTSRSTEEEKPKEAKSNQKEKDTNFGIGHTIELDF